MNALVNTPISTATAFTGDPAPGMLSNVATIRRDSIPTTQDADIAKLKQIVNA